MEKNEPTPRIQSAQALNDKLWDVIAGLENKSLRVSEAKEITNAAGKIIQIALAQLQANTMGASIQVDLLDIPEGTIQMRNATQKKLNAM
jgi:hypothetical protein